MYIATEEALGLRFRISGDEESLDRLTAEVRTYFCFYGAEERLRLLRVLRELILTAPGNGQGGAPEKRIDGEVQNHCNDIVSISIHVEGGRTPVGVQNGRLTTMVERLEISRERDTVTAFVRMIAA